MAQQVLPSTETGSSPTSSARNRDGSRAIIKLCKVMTYRYDGLYQGYHYLLAHSIEKLTIVWAASIGSLTSIAGPAHRSLAAAPLGRPRAWQA